MHDHDFEKQVQQKLDELKLDPSASVWEKVEKRLPVRKKRRPWLIWLPLFFAALGIGGYLFYGSFQSSPGGIITKKPAQSTNLPATSGDASERSHPGIINSESQETVSRKAGLQPENKNLQHSGAKKRITGRELKEKDKVAKNDLLSVLTQESYMNNTTVEPGNASDPDQPSKDKSLAVAEPRVGLISSSINTSSLSLKDPEFPVLKEAWVTVQWEWGLSFRAGRSGFNNGKLERLFGTTAVADVGNNFAGGGIVYQPPSALKPGFGFSAGVYVKRKLTERLSVSAGLNYDHFSSSNLVGTKFDSSIALQGSLGSRSAADPYYRNGNSSTYLNRYHFIGLPVSLEMKVFKNEKIPLFWNLGFSVSELITSNSLHYNSGSGLYFKNNSLFNKTQFDVLTGLNMRLFRGHRFPLEAGPQLQYGISKLLKEESSGSKHLLFLSIQTKIRLGKK